ncbi:MAG: hypothetical protein AUJ96_24075 [Armatimonadetes bacterium CG2_30_66_41]|nr:hypothetical protein [Armatimonadota bacterium]OIO96931.1 MAG: hypothetical protein AUJ96_24075 [Armatimonadetes bacterium CG2_30_66_41]NCO90986.1 hypothetical protein [Armatimonadota bacterium]NCP33574.1 hypothetical protein [Armatimonadota bacterium]NCQ25841.1 hypothetical protein [Armatimonadota bacterium]
MSDRLRAQLPIAGVWTAAAAVRLFRLGFQSLWCDEWFSYNLTRKPLGVLWADAVHDAVHPPLYYLLLHPLAVRTTSEVWLRLPSVVFGVASVWLTYRLALALTNRTAALTAAVLMTLSSFQVYHSQELRMYSMLTCFGVAALWALWKALETLQWRYWLAFVVASTLSLYTNYLAAALAVTAVGALVTHWRCYRRALSPFLVSAALIMVLWLPWGLAMLKGGQGVNERRQQGSAKIATVATAGALLEFTVGYWEGFSQFYRERPPLDTIYMAVLVIGLACAGALLCAGICAPVGRGRKHWFAVHSLLGPLFIGFLVATQTWFKEPRYFALASPAVAVLLAGGVDSLFQRRRLLRWPATAGLFCAVAVSLLSYQFNWRYWRDDWRSVVALVEEQYRPGDGLVFNAGWMDQPFNHYVDLSGQKRWPTEHLPAGEGPTAKTVKEEGDRLLPRYDRLWLILCYDNVTDPKGLVSGFFDHRALFKRQWDYSGVRVRLYECRAKV